MMLLGKAPPGIGWMMRRIMYQNKFNFEQVRSMSHMTTSSGRRYRRMQFQRLVGRVQAQYQKNGINMQKYKIERNLAERVIRDFVIGMKESEEVKVFNETSDRQAHFDKTYKKLK